MPQHVCGEVNRFNWYIVFHQQNPITADVVYVIAFLLGLVFFAGLLYIFCFMAIHMGKKYQQYLLLKEFYENSRYFKE